MRGWLVVAVVVFSGCQLPSPEQERPDAGGACLQFSRESLDFGEVSFGQNVMIRLTVTSLHSQPLRLRAFVDGPFAMDPPEFNLEPGQIRSFDVLTQAVDGLRHVATLELKDPREPSCSASLPVSMLGGGTLVVAPVLDFGFVDAGASVERELVLTNGTRRDLWLLSVSSPDASVFSWADAGSPTLVPALSSYSLRVRAAPVDFEFSTTRLTINTDRFLREVFLNVAGGRPEAELSPSVVDFGHVGLFGTELASARRRVFLKNTGTSGSTALSKLRVSGVSVVMLEGPSVNDVLPVVDDLAFLGVASNQAMGFDVELSAAELGASRWRVTLETNAPWQPVVPFEVKALVETMPPCALTVSPTELSLRGDGGVARGSVLFTNSGSTLCTLDDVRLGATEGPALSLERGEVEQVQLQPGEQHEVVVRAGPTDGSVVSGTVRFHVYAAGPAGQPRQVPVSALVE